MRPVGLIVAMFSAGLFVGIGVYASVGSNAATIPSNIQALALIVVGLIVPAALVVLGSSISADATDRAAKLAHADAAQARKDAVAAETAMSLRNAKLQRVWRAMRLCDAGLDAMIHASSGAAATNLDLSPLSDLAMVAGSNGGEAYRKLTRVLAAARVGSISMEDLEVGVDSITDLKFICVKEEQRLLGAHAE